MKSVFLSYGAPDVAFARKLNAALNRIGIRTFFFERDAPPGERLHRLMRNAVSNHDCLVLVCSRDSLDRPGVLNEIDEALQREAREGAKSILIPIRLDDYVLTEWAPEHPGLAQAIRDRVVADFRGALNDEDIFNRAVAQMVGPLFDVGDVRPPFENLHGSMEIFIADAEGRDARQIYSRTFIPRVATLKQLVLRDFTASGEVVPVSTNLGRFKPPLDEGGKKTLVVELDEPLPRDAPVTHIIELQAIDSYRTQRESFAATVSHHYPLLECSVHLPAARPARTAECVRYHHGQRVPWPGLSISPNRLHLEFAAREPLVGAVFVLEWSW